MDAIEYASGFEGGLLYKENNEDKRANSVTRALYDTCVMTNTRHLIVSGCIKAAVFHFWHLPDITKQELSRVPQNLSFTPVSDHYRKVKAGARGCGRGAKVRSRLYH